MRFRQLRLNHCWRVPRPTSLRDQNAARRDTVITGGGRTRCVEAGAWAVVHSQSVIETASELNQSPTPPTEIAWGEPTALSAKEIAALWGPVEIGLNTIETEQLAPGARLLPQLFV